MENTVTLTLQLDEALQDVLIAELSDWGFETFLQEDQQIQAFAPASSFRKESVDFVMRWLDAHGARQDVMLNEVEPRNWNAQWEASIRPIVVPPFVVAPTWADVSSFDEDQIIIRIDPKMSFGTGHHESTRLILGMLPTFVQPNDRVLDAGTGTGILAIAALKLGASFSVTFDNDPWVEENVIENFALNNVEDQYTFQVSDMDGLEALGFDVIIANIQRNILLEMMPAFKTKLKPGGHLFLAGLLIATDKAPIMERAGEFGLTLVQEAAEGAWWSGVFSPQ